MQNAATFTCLNKADEPAECLIIMPIYNRKAFLANAFASLKAQTFQQWRLIIVDDGSSDEPLAELQQHAKGQQQEVCYIFQDNAGPGAARAKGLTLRKDEPYIAFFDSDDIWLPEYLTSLIAQLNQQPELDWIFCACKRVNLATGQVLLASTHYDEDSQQKSGFFNLKQVASQGVNIFTDNRELAAYQVNQPINAGFQNSVIRATLTEKIGIPHYRIGEDRFFLLAAMLNKSKIGFIEAALVIYNVHEQNLSDTNKSSNDVKKRITVQQTLANAYYDFSSKTADLTIKTALISHARNILFWQVGYNGYLSNNMPKQANSIMKKIAFSFPLKLKFIKTYLVSLILLRFIQKNKR